MINTNAPPFILLLGGSFNPPHVGHFRIAVECSEALRPKQVLFVPCARPPHKPAYSLLPFAVRVAMLRAGIEDMNKGKDILPLGVSEVENERSEFSYTIDTLKALYNIWPDHRLLFTMGSEDYAGLASWRCWQEFPILADLIIVPRCPESSVFFRKNTVALWPEAKSIPPPWAAVTETYALPQGGTVSYLPQPLLDISSTLLREKLLQGCSVDYLIPRGVLRVLDRHWEEAHLLWEECPL